MSGEHVSEGRPKQADKRKTWPNKWALWFWLGSGLYWSVSGWFTWVKSPWFVYSLVVISLGWSLTAWFPVTNWRGLGSRGVKPGVYIQPTSRALYVAAWVVLVLVVLNDAALILLRGIP